MHTPITITASDLRSIALADILDQAKASAETLIEQGWEGGGASYDIGTYHGDAEALAERAGREPTRDERVSLEHQIRRILDERMTDHTPRA